MPTPGPSAALVLLAVCGPGAYRPFATRGEMYGQRCVVPEDALPPGSRWLAAGSPSPNRVSVYLVVARPPFRRSSCSARTQRTRPPRREGRAPPARPRGERQALSGMDRPWARAHGPAEAHRRHRAETARSTTRITPLRVRGAWWRPCMRFSILALKAGPMSGRHALVHRSWHHDATVAAEEASRRRAADAVKCRAGTVDDGAYGWSSPCTVASCWPRIQLRSVGPVLTVTAMNGAILPHRTRMSPRQRGAWDNDGPTVFPIALELLGMSGIVRCPATRARVHTHNHPCAAPTTRAVHLPRQPATLDAAGTTRC